MNRILLLALFTFLGLAQAQVVTSFSIRYQNTTNGNIMLVGNTLMCMSQANSTTQCDTTRMNNSSQNNTAVTSSNQLDTTRNMIFINADPTNPTWPSGRGGSSAATLSLPTGAQVLFAGLYWGARTGENAAGRNQISIKPPGSSTYQPLSGSLIGTITNQGTPTTRPYTAFADVTDLVQASGNGSYWVGGILADTGNDGLGFYAGWSLVVVYRLSSEPLRNLTVYNGLASVSNGNPVTITPSGFLTPITGSFTTYLGAVAFEGDGGITGDQLVLNGVPLGDAQNPSNNFFNSSVSQLGTRFTAKTPNYLNQMAVDVDLIDATGHLPNGSTTATIQFTSSQDVYFPTVLTFATQVYLPDLTSSFSKTGQDINGGNLVPGDILEYTLSFSNTGGDGATNVVVYDPIPAGTQYVPGSLQVLTNATGAPTGTFTDAAGDDIAEFDNANNRVVFRLGTGANASSGGLILPSQGASVRFRVQVLPSAGGQTITNTAQISYNSQTLGTSFSQTASVSANSQVSNPPSLSKAFSPASIPVGSTSTLSITLTNPNPTPATLSAALVDNLPAGLVVASPANASTTCPSGSVSTTPGSSSVTLAAGAQIPANGSCTVSVSVTASTPGSYTNTLAAGALQTNHGSNQSPASAVLNVTGVNVSGQVYHDLEPNGVRNSENWSTGVTVYVKLVQGSTVLAVQTVSPGTGAYSFSGVAPGSYSLVLDNNNSTADTTPTPPAGWHFINPAGGSRAITVAASNLLNQDFGLFHGARVEGRVFYDDGESGGSANNALQDGGERGAASVVSATDGTYTRTAATDGNGGYTLWIPASWGSVTLSHPLRPATGWNNGSSATLVGSWADATSPTSSGAVISLGSASSLAGSSLTRNFGVVRSSLFRPDQSGQTTSPGVVRYLHQFKPGTLGTVTLALTNTPQFGYQLRRDVNCDGDFDDAGEGFQGLPQSFSVGSGWPRASDGSLAGCALEVQVLVPAGVSAGQVDIASLSASLSWGSNPAVQETRGLTDATTVIRGGELRLEKQVRNVSQNTAFAASAQGRPGEVLEYRIQYQNIGSQPIFNVVLYDPIPFFSTLVQNAYGGTGEVELVCPGGAVVRPDLGSTSSITLNLATLCTLPTAPQPGGGSAPALLPGQGGYFVYRVQVN
ncbi:DUF7933 domain-containing protein [Meiothermus taiwanensis]|jgi:uncharacterized repeat protein (TIGR01451 family)|uniref:DUF11 domain-containing protein n=1 Tax=Meiothermus taiwanensis TaxID=172827 RepID=A0A399DW80_9DEIN|nr:SdrD B-like domain-containing protein [Meiothermus taiwanensis]KIQ55545.1 conserved repeat protein [Meiothermus taiwanensis]KZK15938.1 hypothetical protein A3962_08205 [Meiothermus taiwanensis]RIH76327.1 hypothetical protein Mcate_01804 [Meiothermus taiwanensis]